jgi:hypothetical protein
MKKASIFAVLIATVLLVAGCSSGEQSEGNAAPSADGADARVGAAKPRGPKAQLMGGFVPKFAHRVRSQRHDDLGNGMFRHIVIVEYWGLDGDEAVATLEKELKARGLVVKKPVVRDDGAMRLVAQNSKVGRMTVDLNTTPAVALSEGAKGTMHFSWQDASLK